MAQCNLCFRVAFLAVLLPLTSGACVDFYLGMGSGTIPDSNINASSVQSASTPATNGRLNYTSGSSWCAGTSDKNPYLQIDLQTLHIICAVSTQGNSQADQWVKTYTLQLSTDGITWTNYTELGAQAKVLEGNKDRNSNVKHVLYGVLTRYLRFLPQTHQGEVCMRTEVFGVQQKPTCDSQGIGLASSGRIPDNSFSASSIFAPKYAAKFGRLNGTGAWEPKNNGPDEYLQIDLLYEYVICAVATQGNPPTQSVGAQEWTTEYKLRFSLNGTTFLPYKENKLDKAFPGNSGKTDTVKNSLKEHASAKFIRFLPTKHNVHKALRVEAYGILFTKVPSQPPTAFKLTATSSTSITASWQLPPVFARHGRTITGFKLFYKKKGFGGSATTLPISRGSILSGNVTRLDKYTEYEFQVLAFTSDGDGPKSSVVVERTMEDVPSQAPKSLTVTAGSSTTVTASWQLPLLDSRNGIITGFKLFYKKKTASGSLAMLRIDNGAIHDKTVTGLDKNTEYEFQVLAFTSTGDGPKSSPVVVRTMKDGGCVEFYLGMENGAIPDNKLTASTEQSANTPAKNGRMNYASGSSWCARTSDTNPYLQIDLQTLHIICAVSTQGNSQADQWVKTYTLQLSTDEKVWTDYKELGGKVKVLEGNKDRNSNVKHVLYGVLTRYLRFLPQVHQGGVCMRTEVFGVQQKPTCDTQAIGLASSGRIPDDSFSASSIFAPKYAAKYGRLNGRGAWEPKTTTDPDEYLQIDLPYEYVICAVATQGNPPSNSRDQEWTTEYKLRFSLNGTTFFPYKENNTDKAFPGNKGKTDTVKNSLKEFASAKFIHFLPTKYNKFKALRVEVYGILFTKVPSQPPTAFQLTASSSTSITAFWQLPPVFARHGNIAGFKLFYKKKGSGGSATTLSINNGATLSRTVSGLDKFTEYAFQVLAFTSGGNGPKSSVKVKRTMEDAPSQPPANFNVIPTSSTGVTASWQLPPANSRNGIIKGFKLFYKRKDSSGSGIILPINSESTLNKNVNGLYKYTEYEFQVLAFTSAGDGVNSSVIVNRTKEDVPSQPPRGFTLAATTSESITASWQLPPKDSRNGIIIGYKLFYKEKGSSGAGSSKLINSQATRSQEVTGLDKYTDYEFQILAFTSVGDGPKSTVVYEKTKEDAPSQPPSQFNVTVESSTSITASWRLPPEGSRHGIIKGYKLFYQKKGSDSSTFLTLNNIKTSERVTKLDKYTEYEFQMLAFTSAGDGPNSSTVFKTTMQDASDAPTSLSYTDLSPSKSHGPRITLTWSEPAERNGVIRSYTLFYSHDGVAPREISGIGKAALSHTVDVLGGVTYQFSVRAVTIKPGKNATKTVTTKEYAPGAGPELPSSAQVNKTTFNISWEPLLREKSYGKVILYEVKAIFLKKGNLRKRSVIYSPANTSVTFVVLSDLELCSKYNVSVRAYTAEGPGPYGKPLELETSRPEAPGEFKVTDFGTKQITLAWKQYDEKEKIVYTVKYTGTKSYNKTFRDAEKTIEAIKATTQKVEGLIPGTTYEFSVHGNSVCGESASKVVSKMTDMIAPEAPFPHNITDVEVSHTAVDIYLWPVEQKYGPVSAYQVIVLKVAEGIEELPGDYGFRLKSASDAKKEDLNFYIAAEQENAPVIDKPWKFTVGDGEKTANYINGRLESGENYIVYERALTKTENVILEGKASKVAKITISPVPITNSTFAVNVTEGESVSLNCTLSGDGSYTWERQDGTELENAKRKVKGGGRLLEIIDTVIADSGNYTCKTGGSSHTITLQVLVEVKVEMALKVENYNYTKELENKSSPQYKLIEKNFTDEMDFVYRDTPGYIRTEVLKMTKGSVVVDFNIIIQIVTTDPKNETTINDKKVSIVQTTIKEAEDGFVKRLKVSKVIPKTEPPEPNGVEIFDIKSDELSVRWKPSEDAETFDVRTYSVQYRAYGEKTYSEHNQTANTENADYSYRIKSLESETVYMIRVGAVNTYGSNFNEETGHETEPAPFAWWIIVLAVLGVLLILGILIGIIIYRRRRARERREQTETRFRALENQTGSHKGEVAAYHGENVKGLTYSFKNTAFKSGEMNWEEFPHENIKLLDELGSGAFGIVFKGELQKENGNIIPCAVKTLKPSATKVERKDLYNELEIMANVGHHPNLVNLIGACTQDDLLLVIIELAENGCLLDFLKQSRQQDGNNTTSGLTEHMKTSIAVDVARGMAHLARCRCIHRDLAARNVLLGKDYVAKVSDYGMARDVYEQLMYKKETQGKLPVKWMAVESLETYTFTMESDVWAYGILLWEIESGGLKPYAGLSTAELIENLKNGYRMEKPNGCSDEMYQTMRDCWNSSPSARPNFDELIVRLESTITT